MVKVYLGINIPATISLAIVEFIILVLILEVELGLKRPSTLPLAIAEQELMLTVEMSIGLRTSTIPPIT